MRKAKKSKIFRFIENIYTSGIFDEYGIELKSKVIFLNILLSTGFIFLILSGTSAFYHEFYLLSIIDFGLAALAIPIALHLRMSHRTEFASITSVVMLTFLFLYLFINGGVYESGLLWMYMYPIIVLFLLGTRYGTIVVLGFIAAIAFLHFAPNPLLTEKIFEDGIVYRFIATFLFVYIITLYFEKVKFSTQKDLEKRNQELKETIDKLKETEKDLLEKEKFQNDIFNAIQSGLCVIDRNYNILNVNEWMKKYYPDRMPCIGEKCYNVFQDNVDICTWCPSKETLLTRKVNKSIVPYIAGDGGWMEITSYPLINNDGKVEGVIEFVDDITEKKSTEEQLRKNQSNLIAVIDNTKDMIWSIDKDYKIQIFNLAMKTMYELIYNLTPEEGMNIIEAITDNDDAEEWKVYYDRAISGEQFKIEISYELSSDNPLYLEFSFNPMTTMDGSIIGVSCLGRNITDWKEYESSILESEREHRLLFTNAHDAIIIFDPDDEIILDLNERAAQIYGYDKSEMLGNSLKEISKDVHKGEGRLKELLDDEKPMTFQTNHYHKDGHEMTIEVNTSLVVFKGKKAVLSINRDITERIRIEKELKEREENFRTLSDKSPNMIFINQRAA
jgi:PAS domain S-box-containing protein